jgi:hypothetical protein
MSKQLTRLAKEIVREAQLVKKHYRATIIHAMRCGKRLIRAKSLVGHGEWFPWLADHCKLSARSAEIYMNLARRLPEYLKRNPQRVADLSVRKALSLLSSDGLAATKISGDEFDRVLDQHERHGYLQLSSSLDRMSREEAERQQNEETTRRVRVVTERLQAEQRARDEQRQAEELQMVPFDVNEIRSDPVPFVARITNEGTLRWSSLELAQLISRLESFVEEGTHARNRLSEVFKRDHACVKAAEDAVAAVSSWLGALRDAAKE